MHALHTLVAGVIASAILFLGSGTYLSLRRRRSRRTDPDIAESPVTAAPVMGHGPLSGYGRSRLPSADAVTGQLTALADPCPSCGDADCDSFRCEAVEGVIVPPPLHVYERHLERLAAIVDDRNASWTVDTLTGHWTAPRDLLARLEPGSWLAELLTAAA